MALCFDMIKFPRCFCLAAAAVFAIAAVGKLLLAFQTDRWLGEVNPIIVFMSHRQVLIFAGLIELGAAGWILRSSDVGQRLVIVGSLVLVFWLYRVSLMHLPVKQPCSCMGRVPEWMGLSSVPGDTIVIVVLWLLTGGMLLAWVIQLFGRPFVFRAIKGNEEVTR